MRILITGGRGMLGRTLGRRLDAHDLVSVDLEDFDITLAEACHQAFADARPDVVLHCAAMTAVDACETESDLAFKVNALGSANVAAASHRVGARLIAFSTDYVFAGDLARPYHEWDATGPKTLYGASKLAGEDAIRAHCPNHLILRISWLYGPGGPSFVHTMMKLGAEEGAPLKVVDDQSGNPTSTDAVATRLVDVLAQPLVGTMHFTCEGEATWFGFAQEIFRLRGLERGLVPCRTDEYPRPAPRPANSRLEKRALRLAGLEPLPHWKDALSAFLEDHPHG